MFAKDNNYMINNNLGANVTKSEKLFRIKLTQQDLSPKIKVDTVVHCKISNTKRGGREITG